MPNYTQSASKPLPESKKQRAAQFCAKLAVNSEGNISGTRPPEGDYTAIKRDGVWLIVDGDRSPVPIVAFDRHGNAVDSFDDLSNAWAHIDRLRDAAGCGMPTRMPVAVLAMPISRRPEPRRIRGH